MVITGIGDRVASHNSTLRLPYALSTSIFPGTGTG